MGQLFDIGPRGYKQAEVVATLSYTPLSDREAYVTGLRVTRPSADDTWAVTVAGKLLAYFVINNEGNQQLLSRPSSNAPGNRVLWNWFEGVAHRPFDYPVPNGQTLTIYSLGGATADVEIEFKEVTTGTTQPHDINHYAGRHARMPVYAYRAIAPTTTSEVAFDTQVAPPWVPPIFTGHQLNAGYNVDIWGLSMDAAGVNDYHGSSDEQSTTEYVWAIVNGQRLFTRDPQAGFPARGTASATGSANSVYNGDLERFPAFQHIRDGNELLISPAIHIDQGVVSTWGLAFKGTLTNSPDYSKALFVGMCDIHIEEGAA
jgi:hypothetical protein